MKRGAVAKPRNGIPRLDAPVTPAKPARPRLAVSHRSRGKSAKIRTRVGGR